MRSSFISLFLSAWIVAAQPTLAQAPDAGALRQPIERERAATPLPAADPRAAAAEQAPPLALPDDVALSVTAFRFAGNTLLDDGELQSAVQSWLNRPISFADLQRATRAVADTYRSAGWIVSAHLPQQDVTEGVVTIAITESRFAGARMEGAGAARLDSAIALRHVRQTPGRPLAAAELDRSLLLIDDLPGVSVAGALSPGSRDGETELLLRLTDEQRFDGVARLDTGGARFTGRERVLLSMALNSPRRVGDRLRFDMLTSEGSRYARLRYALPLGGNGWQFGVHGSSFDYELVGDFAALDGDGRSNGFGVDASYPLKRSRLRNLYLTFAADDRSFRNEALGARQSAYSTGALTVGVAGNRYDDFGGGGVNSLTVAWSAGRLRLEGLDIGENPALDGSFDKLTYAVSRQQVLTPTLSLAGSLSGQHASDALDSSERYYLGGPDGVRAYPVNDGGGSRAMLVSLELRWLLRPALTAAVFEDVGRVSAVGDERGYSLRGHGLSVEWRAPAGFELEASVATRAGENPNPAPNGAYQDGSRSRTRWWLEASVPF